MDSGDVKTRVDEIRKTIRKQLTGHTALVEPGFDATSPDPYFSGTVEKKDIPLRIGEQILIHGVLFMVEKITTKQVRLKILAQPKD